MPRSTRRSKEGLPPDTVDFLGRLLGGFLSQGRIGAALGEAARWGYVAYLQKELQRGVAVDTPTEDGGTALMHAASGGQLDATRLLLDAGANVNAQDKRRGMTPLLWNLAARHRRKVYVECCRLLLERGADPNIRATDGKDALWWANDRDNRAELLDLLRHFGAQERGG